MSKIATLQSTNSMQQSAAIQSLGYDEEQIVLELMMLGKTNLAIINHYKTQKLRLTLEQVQRVRELAGLVPATPPQKDARASSYTGKRPLLTGAVNESDYTSVSEDKGTLSLRGSVALPPEFRRGKSELATGAARTVSSWLMRGLKGRGWQGTLLALGIYFVVLYVVFLALAHVAVKIIQWMLEHRFVSAAAAVLSLWVWSTFVGKEPVRVRMSKQARGALRAWTMSVSLAFLVAVREGIALVFEAGRGESEAGRADEGEKASVSDVCEKGQSFGGGEVTQEVVRGEGKTYASAAGMGRLRERAPLRNKGVDIPA